MEIGVQNGEYAPNDVVCRLDAIFQDGHIQHFIVPKLKELSLTYLMYIGIKAITSSIVIFFSKRLSLRCGTYALFL